METQKERTNAKHVAILREYFQTLKDLGANAPYVKKTDLYKLVGDKMFVSAKYAGMVISRMLSDEAKTQQAAEMIV